MQKNILDSLIQTPYLYSVLVSPDMKWVAWLWSNIGPSTDVYIAPLDKSEVPRKLTDFKQDAAILSWTEDSKAVVVNHDYDGDERYCLYRVDVATGETTRLTEEHPSCFIRGGQISADNKYLVYGANYDFDLKKEIEPTIVYRQDLKTGEKIKLSSPEKPYFLRPQLNKQGSHVIYQKSDLDPQGEQIWMVDIDGKEDKEILNFGAKVKTFAWWCPNGDDIIFITEAGTYRKVGMYRRSDRSLRIIIDDPSRNIEDAYIPYGSKYMVIVEVKEAQNVVSLLDLETMQEEEFSKLQSVIPYAQISDGVWASRYYNSTLPGDLIIHTSSEIIRSITDVFARVDYTQGDLVKAENYTWTSVDGLKIQGWLYRAKQKSVGTVVFVHGGPTTHSDDSFAKSIQYFVSQGLNVLDPNYRGSTGFGLAFQDAIKVDGWGGKEQDDIVEGIKALIREGIAEEGKVGITGISYGGYSSWFAVTHYPKKYIAASIPICGMTDLVVDYNTTRPDLRGYSEEMMGGTPTQVPERYHRGSPINFIKDMQGRLLIVQGGKDPNVTPENVMAAEVILKKENIPYEKLVFEDEGHGISRPANQRILLERSVQFFKDSFK